MSAVMVRADYCPECGSPEIAEGIEVAYRVNLAACMDCGWSGYREELRTAQDIAEDAANAAYDRRHDEADEWPAA